MTAKRWELIIRQFRYIFYAFFQYARLMKEFQSSWHSDHSIPAQVWHSYISCYVMNAHEVNIIDRCNFYGLTEL